MYFDSLQEVLEMKGHGAFVWSAYAITLGVLTGLIYVPLSRSRQLIREQRQRLLREQSSAQSNAASN